MLLQIYERGPLSRWLQELYDPRHRLWGVAGEPLREAQRRALAAVAGAPAPAAQQQPPQPQPLQQAQWGRKRKGSTPPAEAAGPVAAAAVNSGGGGLASGLPLLNGAAHGPSLGRLAVGAAAAGQHGNESLASRSGSGSASPRGEGAAKRQRKPTTKALEWKLQEAEIGQSGLEGLAAGAPAAAAAANDSSDAGLAGAAQRQPPYQVGRLAEMNGGAVERRSYYIETACSAHQCKLCRLLGPMRGTNLSAVAPSQGGDR